MGKEVTLIEMLEEIASDLVTHLKYYLSQRLSEKGVTILLSTKVKEIGKDYALVEDASGTRKIEGFDAIVLAVGSKSDDCIAKELADKVPVLYVIGDAFKPREALEAVHEGEEIALKI
jgi:NADH dehydrogenase FAD-containing subunit